MATKYDDFDSIVTSTKEDFNKLKDACNDITTVFGTLDDTIKKLNAFYNEFLKSNTGELYIFGLDSFNFQNKLIKFDIENMLKIKDMLFNRIYSDYYRLYNKVIAYVKSDLRETKLYTNIATNNKTFPKYNYLDIYKNYDFILSNDLFYEIVNIMGQLHDHCTVLTVQLQGYQEKQQIGLHINNFVCAHEYRLRCVKTQLELFMNYIQFFINVHTNYLQRFITRIKLMYFQIIEDIKFDNLKEKYNSGKNVLGKNGNKDRNDSIREGLMSRPNIQRMQIPNNPLNMGYHENTVIDNGVVVKPQLSPVEKEEFKKLLNNIDSDSSELARSVLNELRYTTSADEVSTDDVSIDDVTVHYDSGYSSRRTYSEESGYQESVVEHVESVVGSEQSESRNNSFVEEEEQEEQGEEEEEQEDEVEQIEEKVKELEQQVTQLEEQSEREQLESEQEQSKSEQEKQQEEECNGESSSDSESLISEVVTDVIDKCVDDVSDL